MTNLNSDFHLYFEYSEFDSPDQKGSYEHMDVEFLNKLAKARKIAAVGLRLQAVTEAQHTTLK